jgi:transcriptional regulator with XRE-family HTH domain
MLKIKLLRMSRGLSQWELSHQGGMSQGRYSMIERGLIEPTTEERLRLAAVLGTTPSTLFRQALRSMPVKEVGK